jgi:GNAT superfamily N-acetyltransferase
VVSERLPNVTERIEAASLEALHAGASDELRTRLGLRLEWIDGTMVSIAATDPSILLNRAVGLGLNAPATRDGIERICEAYREHDLERFYLGVHPEARPDGIEDLLDIAGLQSQRGWMKFERGPDLAPAAESSLEVREIGTDHIDEFGRIASSGFGLTPEAAPLFRGLVDRSDFRLYMTFADDTPAGTGLLYIDGDCAWFDWAATDPDYRRRGSQRALLAQRIDDAVAVGCTRLLTATGEAVPGDPQHSYHNIEWAGFEPTFVRGNWVPK